MSQTDLDQILSKYQNRPRKFKNQSLQITERKNDEKSKRIVTFMDQKGTPLKTHGNSQLQLLKKLDEVENNLVVSERKYAELFRKYDKIVLVNKEIENQLDKERRSRLQELIDLQNKLILLQTDNKKTTEGLKEKDHKIAVLKQKLIQKDNQLIACEKQLEQINKKLCSTIIKKEQQSSAILKREREEGKIENQKCLLEVTEKYEKQMAELKKQIKRFDNIFIEKEKEKKHLLIEMEQMGKNHQIELGEIRNSIVKNEEEYKRWLDEAKQEKIQLMEKYEEKIQDLRRQELKSKVQHIHGQEQSRESKDSVKSFQKQYRVLQNELYIKKSEIETLLRADQENSLKITKLESELTGLKVEYSRKLLQLKKNVEEIESFEKLLEGEKSKTNEIQIKMQKLKIKCEEVLAENERISSENQSLKKDMKNQLKSLMDIKKQLNHATDNEINMNATLTENILKLNKKIKTLEEQIQAMTAELYAERLQNAKIKEELKETKVELKKQYDLSVENTKKELEEQIKKGEGSTFDDLQRETAYLQLRELEYKYEMMTSEVVTVDQLMRSATKIHKYYKNKK